MARDTNFYYSFLVLPSEKRKAIIAVWDFCRTVDDAVDCPADDQFGQPAALALNLWREELASCYSTVTPTTRQGRNLKPVIAKFRLPRRPFDDLIDGVAMDTVARRYRTFDDLYEYCIRVASAVGLLCIEIFGYRDPKTTNYAIALGVALQLTNIIRDIPTDLRRGRLYLPTDDLARFGCSEEDLRDGSSERVISLLRYECAQARLFYDKADAVLPPLDRRRMVAAEIMGAIYFALLKRIEGRNCDVFSAVVRVPRWRRAVIAGTVWLRTMFGMTSLRGRKDEGDRRA